MKRLIVLVSVILSVFMVNGGVSLKRQAYSLTQTKDSVEKQIAQLRGELAYKSSLKQAPPVAFTEAFTELVNQMSLLGAYSGVVMYMSQKEVKDKTSVQAMCQMTEFRQISGLPVEIKVQKASISADLGAALDAIRLLEKRTDLKIGKITQNNDDLLVKGTLYGF